MELNRMIDHTILKADASKEAVMQIIEEAIKNTIFILSASIQHGLR
ncbi:hypothetical protein EfmAA94_00700 [Enterococcus faecium]|nr:hypothetical protein EfmAA94_00700 [Enterococcus faecium]